MWVLVLLRHQTKLSFNGFLRHVPVTIAPCWKVAGYASPSKIASQVTELAERETCRQVVKKSAIR